MADVSKMLAESTRSLLDGDSEGALRHLSDVERKLRLRPELMNAEIEAGLARLSGLAHAAAAGIADARALIQQAGGNARSHKTYDEAGKAQPVKPPRGALGRY